MGITSRNETPMVTAIPRPTQSAVIAPRSMKRLTARPRGGRAACRDAWCPGSEDPAAGRARERCATEVAGVVAQFVRDPEEPVVLGHPLGAGRGAGLDLAGAHRDHE